MIATTGFWLAPLLLSVPLFSRDTYSYLAQGALLRDGLDPYAVGPIENQNSLLDNVSPIWTTTTAPYGPAFILVADSSPCSSATTWWPARCCCGCACCPDWRC